jgi:hypothetical protein
VDEAKQKSQIFSFINVFEKKNEYLPDLDAIFDTCNLKKL